jgi:hypothetical protein
VEALVDVLVDDPLIGDDVRFHASSGERLLSGVVGDGFPDDVHRTAADVVDGLAHVVPVGKSAVVCLRGEGGTLAKVST